MSNSSGADPTAMEEGLAEGQPRRRRGRSLNDVFTATRMLGVALGPHRGRISAFMAYLMAVICLLYLVRVYGGAVRLGWPVVDNYPSTFRKYVLVPREIPPLVSLGYEYCTSI